jgi:DNA-binding transcriptional regulator GbsR (MarR family)
MENREQKIRELIEDIGIFYKKTGHQAMMGRVMGYLMVADPPHQTFEQIVDFLFASKSSVSNTLNMLMLFGVVKFKTLPGDRKRYFMISAGSMESFLMRQAEEIIKFREVLQSVLDMRSPGYPETNREISESIRFIDIYEKELPGIIGKWKKEIEQTKK